MAAEKQNSMFQVIDGERYIFFRDPAKVLEALRFQPSDGDVIQSVYPKCGMQIAQQMMQLIVNYGESAKDFREFSARAPFIEDCGGKAQVKSSPQIFRTHIRLGRIAVNPGAKYVYVARNPWDACYSQYIMDKQMPLRPMRETFDEFLDMFLQGSLTNGCYFEHVHSGYTRRNEPNVFFTTYEELKRDTPGNVLRLADFLGDTYGKRFRQDKALLDDVIRKCDLDHLKNLLQMDRRHMVDMMLRSAALAGSDEKESDFKEGTLSLVCRPEVGCWTEVFTKQQLHRMATKIESSVGKEFVRQLWKDEWESSLEGGL